MRSLTRQNGMTGIGWLIVLALIGFFTLLALRMVPAYLEHYKIVSTLESLTKESGFQTPNEIRTLIERRFDISYVNVILPRDVKIKPSGKFFDVTAQYEAREHIAGNVYVVMSFNKRVQVKRF